MVETGSDEREKDLQDRLDRALHRELTGIKVERVVALGEPAGKIVDYAHANSVDLIMMPTHGFGIFRGMLIGSVTAKVLHDAKCPVWTSAHAEVQRAPVQPKTIVCAIDRPSNETLVQARWANEFSQRMGATSKLLHAVPPVSNWLAIPTEADFNKRFRDEAYATLEPYLKQKVDVQAPLRVVIGKIAECISEEAKQEGADLIVIGRGAANSPLGRLRSNVFGIIQQAQCPVVSV